MNHYIRANQCLFWFQVTFFFNITFFEQQSVIKYVVPGTLNDNVNKQLHQVMLLRSSYSEKILKMPLDYSKLNATWRSKSLFNNHVIWNHKMFWCSDKKEDLVKISSSYVRCLKLLLRQKDMGLAVPDDNTTYLAQGWLKEESQRTGTIFW